MRPMAGEKKIKKLFQFTPPSRWFTRRPFHRSASEGGSLNAGGSCSGACTSTEFIEVSGRRTILVMKLENSGNS
jgi:hypothetical protein